MNDPQVGERWYVNYCGEVVQAEVTARTGDRYIVNRANIYGDKYCLNMVSLLPLNTFLAKVPPKKPWWRFW